ncbi:hypothetical protein ACFU5Z_01335 [Streptomyces sp. NPDC057521]|uniref:hypothetical protein n=1 Tax=Streptomyces sp. NPDC057521 TaxID=3346156 RepID=UPI0036A11993
MPAPPKRTIPRLTGLTRHLWARDKTYDEDYHHYDKKVPFITTTLTDHREHGPHGQVFHRFGHTSPQNLFDATGNPRRDAPHWAQHRAREGETASAPHAVDHAAGTLP